MAKTQKLAHKVSTVVDDETKQRLSAEAERDGRSEGAIVRRALRQYLNLNGSNGEAA